MLLTAANKLLMCTLCFSTTEKRIQSKFIVNYLQGISWQHCPVVPETFPFISLILVGLEIFFLNRCSRTLFFENLTKERLR
jgi:hypothetical protein